MVPDRLNTALRGVNNGLFPVSCFPLYSPSATLAFLAFPPERRRIRSLSGEIHLQGHHSHQRSSMGDRSPKSNQKQKSQQAAKSADASAQKQKAIQAKQGAPKK